MGRLTTGDGDAQWYALRVHPQKEYTAAYLLERAGEGVWAFVPTESRFGRRTRYSKAQAEYARPEMPGCIIVRFDSDPIWYNVLRNNLVMGPIGGGGFVWRLHDMISFLSRTTTGRLVIQDGTQLVEVNGRLMRAPTSHKRIISRRDRDAEPPVIEAKGRLARWLEPHIMRQRAVLKAAA